MAILCGFIAKYNSDINEIGTVIFASIGCVFFGLCFICGLCNVGFQTYHYWYDPYGVTNPSILPISIGMPLKEIIITTHSYDANRKVGSKIERNEL
jgi:hypothetical protein